MAKTEAHLKSPVTLLKPRGVAMTVFLPEAVHENLRNLAAANERSLSGEMRWALRRYSEYPDSLND